jgi:hypothetical protein
MRRARLLAAAALLACLPAIAAAEKVSEKELIARTALDPVVRSQRLAEIAAMSPQQQADGRLFMWYPRNGSVVRGTWALRDMDGPEVCDQYRNAVHGVTGEYEPNECISPQQKLLGEAVLDSRNGDPFGLARGVIPYPKAPRDIPAWPDPAKGG